MKVIAVEKIPAGCICARTKAEVIRWAIKINGERPKVVYRHNRWWMVKEDTGQAESE